MIWTVDTAIDTVIRQIKRSKQDNTVAVIILFNLLGKRINLIDFLWYQNTRTPSADDVKRREDILKEKFSEMCEKVIEEKINIYADSYYVQYNVWGLIRYLKIKENREDIVHKYIARIINEENIFRVMGDMITQSIGNAYGYKIGDENFAIFFENVSLLDSLLQKVVPKTQSEEFVLKVYEKFKSGETNSWGDKEIISEVEVLLKL